VPSPIPKTREAPSALTVSFEAPGPSIITERVGVSMPAESRTRPLTAKTIRSGTSSPAAQPFWIVSVFAARIASLSVHLPASVGSRRLFTTIGFRAS
jgi:hypothetical protein